jgi:hypothetical protein
MPRMHSKTARTGRRRARLLVRTAAPNGFILKLELSDVEFRCSKSGARFSVIFQTVPFTVCNQATKRHQGPPKAGPPSSRNCVNATPLAGARLKGGWLVGI